MADALLNTIDTVLEASDEVLQESQQESGSSTRYITYMICGSPVQKSKVIPLCISIASLPLKRCIAELLLKAGLICTS